MSNRVVVLGAGFGGMELCTTLSEALGEAVAVTLIDKSDHFVFGYSKLDIMFGRSTPEAVRLPYRNFLKPGVTLSQYAADLPKTEMVGENEGTVTMKTATGYVVKTPDGVWVDEK